MINMVARPDLAERNKLKVGILNSRYGKKPWNYGIKGVCKPNSGCFVKGKEPWNKGKKGIQVAWNKGIRMITNKEIPKIPEIIALEPILSEQDKIKIALDRISAQRLQKIEAYKIEVANRSKEKIYNNFSMTMCILENKMIKCKKPKSFCSHWKFCHKDK